MHRVLHRAGVRPSDIEAARALDLATHEWLDILRDVATARSWRDPWSFLVRGPGWVADRRAALAGHPEDAELVAACGGPGRPV